MQQAGSLESRQGMRERPGAPRMASHKCVQPVGRTWARCHAAQPQPAIAASAQPVTSRALQQCLQPVQQPSRCSPWLKVPQSMY